MDETQHKQVTNTASVAFFFATFAITWLLQMPAVLVKAEVLPGPIEKYMLFLGLSALGPTFGALVVSSIQNGREGRRELFQGLKNWRVSPGWYAIALLSSGSLFLFSMLIYRALGFTTDGPLVYLPVDAPSILALVFFSFGEEIGWRGYALPHLQQKYGSLLASVIIGIVWGVWHIPMFYLSNIPPATMVVTLPFFCAGSIVFTWLYNRTRFSLLIAVLTHMGAHLNNSNKALPADTTPLILHTIAYCIAAVILVLVEKKYFYSAVRDKSEN